MTHARGKRKRGVHDRGYAKEKAGHDSCMGKGKETIQAGEAHGEEGKERNLMKHVGVRDAGDAWSAGDGVLLWEQKGDVAGKALCEEQHGLARENGLVWLGH